MKKYYDVIHPKEIENIESNIYILLFMYKNNTEIIKLHK